jgi:hypothetical protein
LTTVRERCDPPFPGTSDPSGIARAFPEGLPIREEARVAAWAVAAARRLGGAVRFDETGTVLVPRADAAIDLTVYSNLWLEPDSALALGLRVSPAFRLATGGRARDGLAGAPSKRRGLHTAVGAGSSPLPDQVSSALSKAQRAQLHQRADAYDTEMLQRKPGTDRYALRGDFGAGGLVWLEVSGGEAPMALRKLAWARFGAVAYGVRWDPVDSRDALVEFPDARQRDERSAAAGMIARLAREIHRVTGIEVLDADGFPVNPADL